MNTQRVNGAAGVILAALTQNRTPAGIALALESAGLLMTPETAADMASVSKDAVGVAERAVEELKREHAANAELRARVDELVKTARIEAIADVGDWLDEHGQKDAAYLVYTVDIPEARSMKPVPDGITRRIAPTQALREDAAP